MYDQKTFSGGVQSRTVANGNVESPLVVTLDGFATELTLSDAKELRDGLVAAIAAVDASEQAVIAGQPAHHFTFGRTMYGMSSAPSKLSARTVAGY